VDFDGGVITLGSSVAGVASVVAAKKATVRSRKELVLSFIVKVSSAGSEVNVGVLQFCLGKLVVWRSQGRRNAEITGESG
jgi:predicted outer membrane protein